ncbi:hypothetical protein JG688_00002367 [Phytophthora aleatoria]|uniref:GAG-pre-integrase domain-containing protein n=1 Tax=Phytophthora aleatoria TaxID=2496075 RepID=A0A8J5IUQ6_9STRA|nr:hypothetical protein JG688_00002367 [Phytophthora aleatoria]
MHVRALVDDGRGEPVKRYFVIDNVYYVPGLKNTLISISTLVQTGHLVEFTVSSCTVYNANRRRIGCIDRLLQGGYSVITEDAEVMSPHATMGAVFVRDLEAWHRRLGYVNYDTLQNLARSGTVRGLKVSPSSKPPMCTICALMKSTRLTAPS